MKSYDAYFEANRKLWDSKTPVHLNSEFYEVDAFKAGASTLRSVELEELGEVKAKSLLHLQCHFGMDTLSWAREGAVVTGMDFSEAAIARARELSTELNIPADFVCCNLYDL
ncbi:MAG: methyltransferase domain-containing protein, partial [Bacteroidota bacterium]